MRGLTYKERAARWRDLAVQWKENAELYKALALYWEAHALARGAEPLPPITLDVPDTVPSEWA